MAAVVPSPTALATWRGEFLRMSPMAKMPGNEVVISSSVIMCPSSSSFTALAKCWLLGSIPTATKTPATDITEVLPDIIQAGAIGINPLEPDILDIKQIRADYPDLIFWGGIDNNELLCRGSVPEVEQAVKNLIDIAGKNGRLLLGSAERRRSEGG